jgi:hypothetical protein
MYRRNFAKNIIEIERSVLYDKFIILFILCACACACLDENNENDNIEKSVAD